MIAWRKIFNSLPAMAVLAIAIPVVLTWSTWKSLPENVPTLYMIREMMFAGLFAIFLIATLIYHAKSDPWAAGKKAVSLPLLTFLAVAIAFFYVYDKIKRSASGEGFARLGEMIQKAPHHWLPLAFLTIGLVIAALLALTVHALLVAKAKSDHLKNSEETNRLLVDGLKDHAICLLDVQGVIKSWSAGAEAIHSYTAEEIVGRHVSDLYTPGDQEGEEPRRMLEETAVSGKLEDESWRVRKDGSPFMAHVVMEALQNTEGTLIGFVMITRDITQKTQQEIRFKQVSYRLALATNAANIGVWDWDIRTGKLIWDDMMLQLYGIERANFSGDYEAWGHRVHSEDQQRVRDEILKSLEGQKFDTVFRICWPDGSLHDLRAIADAIRDDEGNIAHMVGVNWDVTHENEIARLKNEFISIVNHELRTPLTSIYMFLELLKDERTWERPEKTRGLVSVAIESCERLGRLINDMLDLEKISSGKMEFHMRPVDLGTLVSHCLQENKAYAERFHVSLLAEAIPDGVFVEADPDRLMQVMANLLSNAAKFSPSGETICITMARRDSWVRVSVSDHGPGIAEEFRSRIFQKFSQADSSSTRQKEGTGLGLSICKAIIDKHGGDITYESAPGTGTTFYFELPERATSA